MEDVAEWIHAEMRTNIRSRAARSMRDNWRALPEVDARGPALTWGPGGLVFHPPSIDIDVPNPTRALRDWKNMVGNRRPWDHKAAIRAAFGDWSDDRSSGLQYFYDIWSNLHYGYVGSFIGFGAWLLKAGAGYAQVAAGTNPGGYWDRRAETLGDADFLAAFDDPKDQEAIMVGVHLWEQQRATVSVTDVVEHVRLHAARSSTRTL